MDFMKNEQACDIDKYYVSQSSSDSEHSKNLGYLCKIKKYLEQSYRSEYDEELKEDDYFFFKKNSASKTSSDATNKENENSLKLAYDSYGTHFFRIGIIVEEDENENEQLHFFLMEFKKGGPTHKDVSYSYIDSIQDNTVENTLKDLLNQIIKSRGEKPHYVPKNCFQQKTNSDICGVLVLMNIEILLKKGNLLEVDDGIIAKKEKEFDDIFEN